MSLRMTSTGNDNHVDISDVINIITMDITIITWILLYYYGIKYTILL